MSLRTLTIIASVLCLVSCAKSEKRHQSLSYEDSIAAIQKAQDDAERTHLGEQLEDAGTNIRKLKEVYDAAVRLKDTKTAAAADARLTAIVLPRVMQFPSPRIILKYLKKVPAHSSTHERLLRLYEETLKTGH
jgi:hypothetical protein